MDDRQFLFVSTDAALIGDVARQVHDVKYYVEAERDREIGDGFVPKTDNARTQVGWADVIVFDTDDTDGQTRAPDDVHIEDAKRVDGQWRAAGESGMPLVVTGKGETMRDAQRQAYERVNDVRIPNLYCRDDIGDRWISVDGDRLHAWGYLGPG